MKGGFVLYWLLVEEESQERKKEKRLAGRNAASGDFCVVSWFSFPGGRRLEKKKKKYLVGFMDGHSIVLCGSGGIMGLFFVLFVPPLGGF